jgi:hypothetical protein
MTPPLFFINIMKVRNCFNHWPHRLAVIQCLLVETGKEGTYSSSCLYGVYLAGLC